MHSKAIWSTVGMLALVNAVNYMDRMAISVLLPSIQRELTLSDTSLGVLTGYAFALFYAAAGLPIARIADRSSRRNVIAVALVAWSALTAATGLVHNFWQLFFARVGIAIGEAGCIPASHSLISDLVPANARAKALGLHGFGSAVGVLLGFALGGWLGTLIGWRHTFWVLGISGIVISFLFFATVREPSRNESAAVEPPPLAAALRWFWESRSFVALQIVFSLGMLSQFGLALWMPMFYERLHGLGTQEIGLWVGLAFGGGSAMGMLIGAFLADRLIRADPRNGARLIGVSFAASVPLSAAALLVSSSFLSLVLYFCGAVAFCVAYPPLYALIQTVSPPRMRALAMSITAFVSACVGSGSGPFLAGLTSDMLAASFGTDSLRVGLLAIALIGLWPALHTRIVSRHLSQRIAHAEIE